MTHDEAWKAGDLNAVAWLSFFPEGADLVLSYRLLADGTPERADAIGSIHQNGGGTGAAIARIYTAASFTRERYYAREYGDVDVGDRMTSLLGPVDTLPAAVQLLSPAAQAQIYPDRPRGA